MHVASITGTNKIRFTGGFDDANRSGSAQGFIKLNIEALGIPTGVQTVQAIVAKYASGGTITVSGTIDPSRIYFTTHDHS